MIAALLVVLILIGVFWCVGSFLFWALREHTDAEKWRRFVPPNIVLERPGTVRPEIPVAPVPSIPQWEVTFKDGGKIRTVMATGATEAEAIKELIKQNAVGYGSIISSIRK